MMYIMKSEEATDLIHEVMGHYNKMRYLKETHCSFHIAVSLRLQYVCNFQLVILMR
jgi:hypothetical protein